MNKSIKIVAIAGASLVGAYVIYRIFQASTASQVATLKTQQLTAAKTTAAAGGLFAPLAPVGLAVIDPNSNNPPIVMSQGALINPATVSNFLGVQKIY